jgi:hypothetical protein
MRAVELLEQDDPGQLMGERQPTEREPVIDLIEVEPERAANHEAQVPAASPALLEKATEGDRIELLARPIEQRDEPALGQSPPDVLVLPDLDHLDPGVSSQQLVVMLVVIGEWLPQPAHGDDNDPHG